MKQKYQESFPHSNKSGTYGCTEIGLCGDPCFLLDLHRGFLPKQEMELRWFSIDAQMPLFPATVNAPAVVLVLTHILHPNHEQSRHSSKWREIQNHEQSRHPNGRNFKIHHL